MTKSVNKTYMKGEQRETIRSLSMQRLFGREALHFKIYDKIGYIMLSINNVEGCLTIYFV